MLKKISFTAQGQRADIHDITIFRMLPNRYADAVGPFVFLDHIAPMIQSESKKGGTGPHPHRGIATLSYILNGEIEHRDSIGHYNKVHSGGIQWMKAGSGIVHDENLSFDQQSENKLVHGFQFWINLPSKIKTEKPEYLAVEGVDVPKRILDNESGWLKVIIGEYEDLRSKIPNYSNQFLYHIHLEAGKEFSINLSNNVEVAAFSPLHDLSINQTNIASGEFVEFDRAEGTIEFHNSSNDEVDVLLFGGENYAEKIVAEGPFVMNSKEEIAQAYRDFFAGKYGQIQAQ